MENPSQIDSEVLSHTDKETKRGNKLVTVAGINKKIDEKLRLKRIVVFDTYSSIPLVLY